MADGPRNERENERDARVKVQSGTSGWNCEERWRDWDREKEERRRCRWKSGRKDGERLIIRGIDGWS